MVHKNRPQWKLAVALIVLAVVVVGGLYFWPGSSEPAYDEVARQQLEEKFNITVKAVVHDPQADTNDIFVEDEGGSIDLYGVPAVENITSIAIVSAGTNELASNVAVVTGTTVERAVIRLQKQGQAAAIVRCDDYDAATQQCSQWVNADIPFSDYGSYVEFEVAHFTGYGVIPKTQNLTVTGTADYTDVTATPALGVAQDGAQNDAAFVVASTTLYPVMNASVTNVEARVIRTTDVITFSSYWQGGSRVDFAYATFKLYAGTNGGTLVCQSGNDNTGGTQIPDNGVGVRTGVCSPSSNFTVNPGDDFYYVINLYASSIGGGGPDSSRTATLLWDTATARTWINVSSVQLVDVNLRTNVSVVYPGQTINASGDFYYFNTTSIAGRNVNITFFNGSNARVQNKNVTTNATGNFSDVYTLPLNAIPGTWKVNVTAYINATVYATNEMTFTVHYYTTPTSPANDTLVDRDASNASVADSIQLIAVAGGAPAAGTTLSFYANLTDPVIGGQTNIVLGGNSTNSSGHAMLWYNPSSAIYAGNYTWWAQGASGVANATRTYLVMGQLNTTFNDSAVQPSATYFYNQSAEFRTNISSAGPETRSELDSLYSITATSRLLNTTGSSSTAGQSFNAPFWESTMPLAALKGAGIWIANFSAGGKYLFANTTQRSVTIYGYSNVSSNSTAPSSISAYGSTTAACKVIDQDTAYPLNGLTVQFYQNTTLLGTNTTNSTGDVVYSFQVNGTGTWQILCRTIDQPAQYYYPSTNGYEGNSTLVVTPFVITMQAPANDTIIDRDGSNATDADAVLLNASTSAGVPAGIPVTFYADIVDPAIGAPTITLGTNTTVNGYAALWFDANSTLYAGNYTWWAASASGTPGNYRRFMVKGQLLIAYNSSTQQPNSSHFLNESASIYVNLTSQGPETRSELESLYGAGVNNTVTNASGSSDDIALAYNNPFWFNAHTLLALKGVGSWQSLANAGSYYWYNTEVSRNITMYSYMNVSSNSTSPSSISEEQFATTVCGVQDKDTQYEVAGVNVTFYRNSTYLGYNTTNSSGHATYSFSTVQVGNYTVFCNTTDQPAIYYYRGPVWQGTSLLEVQEVARPPNILNIQEAVGVNTANISWTTDRTSNSSIRWGTTTALLTGVNNSAATGSSHMLSMYGLIENTVYYYNITSCSFGCNTTGPFSFSTALDLDPPTVNLITPIDGGGDDSNVTFTYSVVDNYGIASCTLYVDTIARDTDFDPITSTFTLPNVALGEYDWTVDCTDSSISANSANASTRAVTVINASGFTVSDLSNEDMGAVNSFSIENNFGKINFSGPINFTGGMAVNEHIFFGSGWIYVNSSQPELDKPARISMYGLSFALTPFIERDGVACGGTCTSVSYSGGELSFNVTGFSNYTAEANAQLAISDDTDTDTRYVTEFITFYANYTRTSNNNPISGVDIFCEYTENSTGSYSSPVNMTYNGTNLLYEYTTSFIDEGVHLFNVTCDGSVGGHETLTISDAFNVSALSGSPAFDAAVVDGSSSGFPTVAGVNITFNGTATDPESDDWELIICTTNAMTNGTCDVGQWCRTGFVNSGQQTSCQVETTALALENYSWHAFACDTNDRCSIVSNANSPFHVNHMPSITSISISPTAPNSTSTLSCVVGMSDDDGDIVALQYSWYLQNEGAGAYALSDETGSTIANKFDSNDNMICGAVPIDEHGLAGPADNSSAEAIIPGILSAGSSLTVTEVIHGESTTLTVSCSVEDGETANVTLTVQDNHTGVFAQSSTNPAAVYVNASSIAVGSINDTTKYYNVTIYTQTVGNYSFRSLCQAADTNPMTVSSTPVVLAVTFDTTPPIINNVQVVDRTVVSARITWTTNENSDSLVDYGLNSTLDSSVYDPSSTISHSVLLVGLTIGTEYYFNVTSCNDDGYCSTYGMDSFMTLEELGLAAPNQQGYCTAVVIEQGPNYREGFINEGDVIEFYCESPNEVAEREDVTITLINKNRQLRKEVTSPTTIFGEQVAVYP